MFMGPDTTSSPELSMQVMTIHMLLGFPDLGLVLSHQIGLFGKFGATLSRTE
jgi:hypothetical protein